MKTNRLVMCSVLILGFLFAQPAWADTIAGKVVFLGTVSQRAFPNRERTAFLIGLSSTCNGTRTVLSIEIFLTSFIANPTLGDVTANFRNAYSTLLAALLAGNSVQIEGQVSCNTAPQETNFRTLEVGIIAEP